MPINRAPTAAAPKEQRLPPIVRDYLEHVRGRPEMILNILPDYLDSLWKEAADYSRRYDVPAPIRRDEVEALRVLVTTKDFAGGLPQ
jgi:hypothetical protein